MTFFTDKIFVKEFGVTFFNLLKLSFRMSNNELKNSTEENVAKSFKLYCISAVTLIIFALASGVVFTAFVSKNESRGYIENNMIYFDDKCVSLKELNINNPNIYNENSVIVKLDEKYNVVDIQTCIENRITNGITVFVLGLVFGIIALIPVFILKSTGLINLWLDWARNIDNLKKFAEEDEIEKIFKDEKEKVLK